jgi:signal-transduction protein with cAMP-binding, CBS, and nucleotidyltransferase domain
MLLSDKENLELPVSEIMEKSVVILDESTSVSAAAEIMKTKGISSVLVKDHHSDKIKGIVTERDILYRVVAEAKGAFKVSIGSIMSSPLVTIERETQCIEAITMMRKKGLRRLPVVDKEKIVGIVTLMSLVGNMPIRNIDLAELEAPVPPSPSNVILNCPYCQSKFNGKKDLSSHIDRIHLGSGLLEGDLRKWE